MVLPTCYLTFILYSFSVMLWFSTGVPYDRDDDPLLLMTFSTRFEGPVKLTNRKIGIRCSTEGACKVSRVGTALLVIFIYIEPARSLVRFSPSGFQFRTSWLFQIWLIVAIRFSWAHINIILVPSYVSRLELFVYIFKEARLIFQRSDNTELKFSMYSFN